MSIAFVASADLGNNGGGSSSLTVAYSCGSGSNRLLIVVVQGDTSTDDITGITYNGVAMTQVGKQQNNRWTYMYYLLNPASGSHNVVVSASSGHYLIAVAADYTGVKQSAQPDASTTGHRSGAGASTLTTTLTVVAANSWGILAGGGYDGNFPPSAGTGSTLRRAGSAFGMPALFDSNGDLAAGSRSMTFSFTGTGLDVGSVMASFAPAVSAATGDAAITEADDMVSAAGAVAVAGAAAITEAGDTVAGTGTAPITGAAAITEGADTLIAVLAPAPATGDADITEDDDASAGELAILRTGNASITEDGDTLLASTVIVGRAAITEANDTVVAAGTAPITGTAAIAESADTVSAAGTAAALPIPPGVFKPATTSGDPGHFRDGDTTGTPGHFKDGDEAGTPGHFKPGA